MGQIPQALDIARPRIDPRLDGGDRPATASTVIAAVHVLVNAAGIELEKTIEQTTLGALNSRTFCSQPACGYGP